MKSKYILCIVFLTCVFGYGILTFCDLVSEMINISYSDNIIDDTIKTVVFAKNKAKYYAKSGNSYYYKIVRAKKIQSIRHMRREIYRIKTATMLLMP